MTRANMHSFTRACVKRTLRLCAEALGHCTSCSRVPTNRPAGLRNRLGLIPALHAQPHQRLELAAASSNSRFFRNTCSPT